MIFCWVHDLTLRAAQLALAEDGLDTMPCNAGGNRLIVRRKDDNRYLMTLYVRNGYYILDVKGDGPGLSKKIGKYEIADPDCFSRIYSDIKKRLNEHINSLNSYPA